MAHGTVQEAIVSQVHREADAALTSHTSPRQAPWCARTRVLVPCVSVCAFAQRDTGVSHPSVIELAELWLNTHREKKERQQKLNALRYPNNWRKHLRHRQTVAVSPRFYFFKKAPSFIKLTQKKDEHIFFTMYKNSNNKKKQTEIVN